MPYAIPALSEMKAILVAVGRSLFPDRNYTSPRSYHSKRAGFFAAAATQIGYQIAKLFADNMPDTASDGVNGQPGAIDRWGGIKNVIRKDATVASKPAAARVRGTPGTAVTVGQQLKHKSSGLLFQIATTTAVGGSGYVDADIASISKGSAARLDALTVLEFVTTPPFLETQVVLQKDIDQGGFDREGFGSYRGRVLDAFANPQSGGNKTDYVAWGEQLAGITSAYSFPNRAGIGTIDIVGLKSGTGAARVLSAGELAALIAYLQGLAPAPIAAQYGPLRGLSIVLDPQPVEIVLTPNGESAYAFDWTGGPLAVVGWTPATLALQVTALPSGMKAGHHISLKGVATAQDGREYRIAALSGVDTMILETAPTVAPAATDLVYSGGPLVTPVRDAILAHGNGEIVYAGKRATPAPESSLESVVGLEVLADGIGPANPAGVYGTWAGGIYLATLGKIAIYKAGVRNYQIVAPAADYEATDDAFPNDAQIHLIYFSSVLVRGAT